MLTRTVTVASRRKKLPNRYRVGGPEAIAPTERPAIVPVTVNLAKEAHASRCRPAVATRRDRNAVDRGHHARPTTLIVNEVAAPLTMLLAALPSASTLTLIA